MEREKNPAGDFYIFYGWNPIFNLDSVQFISVFINNCLKCIHV